MTSEEHPYKVQPPRAFWRRVAGSHRPTDIGNWYKKKWDIGDARIAAAGSCFAQHLGRRLRQQGFNYLNVEPTPHSLPDAVHGDWGFGMYSARYGNIYTARQLIQLVRRATGEFVPQERVWTRDDGFVDPFRPNIEPVPLASAEEVEACAASHLASVVKLLEQTDLFVFTLGLTEGWVSRTDGAVYPLCPGTQGGQWDSSKYQFVNFSYNDVLADMQAFIDRVREFNPSMRFLLTVSPVPLMATATQHQVVVATEYSKSVLRSVAGYLADTREDVDYFPSYEIISAHVMRGQFYEDDLRGVKEQGVEFVMKQFFLEHQPPAGTGAADAPAVLVDKDDDGDGNATPNRGEGRRQTREARRQAREARQQARKAKKAGDVVCEEALLDAFGGKP